MVSGSPRGNRALALLSLGRVLQGIVVLTVCAGLGMFGMRRWEGPEVVVVFPARRALVQTVVSSGRVLSPGEVNLGSMVGGLVRAVHVREGDRVSAGQLLVAFDDEELAAQVAQARAGVLVANARIEQLRGVGARVAGESVRQAEANLRAAEAVWTRQQALFRAGVIAAAEVEAAQRALEVSRSVLQASAATAAGSRAGGGDARVVVAGRVQAAAVLRSAEVRLEQTRILAPASGVILRRTVEPGDVVSPGRTLLVLLRDGAMELSVTPDERNLAQLRIGQHAVASAEAFPSQPFDAEVSYLAPAIDALRGTVEVRLRVPAPPVFLRPAMTVSVEVEVARSAHALTLPSEAVRDASMRSPWVLVRGPDGRAARRFLRLGLRGDRVVEVLSGIEESMQVLVNSEGVVGEGQRFRARLRTATRAAP